MTSDLSSSGPHLTFQDEVLALQPHVDKLLTLGVNKIIALGHSGFTVDQQIAKRVRGLDVVIGGHTNTFLYTGGGAKPRTGSETLGRTSRVQQQLVLVLGEGPQPFLAAET